MRKDPYGAALVRVAFAIAAAVACPGVGIAESAVYSDAQASRGESAYQTHCASCHGARLEGNAAVALSGARFRERWEDGAHTLDDLFYIVRTLMPNSAPGSLSRPEYADIVAYILKVNGYPAGDAELVPAGSFMKGIILQPH